MKDIYSIAREAADLNGHPEDARYRLFEQYIEKTIAAAVTLRRQLPEGILFDEQDFVMIGLQALWKMSERYDVSSGSSFWTYARSGIIGSMIDEMRKSDFIPRSQRAMIKGIENKRRELEQQTGHEATFDQACSVLGIDSEKQSELQEITSMRFVSVDKSNSDDGSSGSKAGNHSFEEIIADPNGIDPTASTDRGEEMVVLEKLLNRLEPMERSLIRLYFFSGLRLNDIAKAMSLTESRVSQRLTKVLEKLRAFAESDGIHFHQHITWE